MINDSLLSTYYKFHDHKQKIVKANKKFLFPLKFKIFEIRGFDSTATICLTNNPLCESEHNCLYLSILLINLSAKKEFEFVYLCLNLEIPFSYVL